MPFDPALITVCSVASVAELIDFQERLQRARDDSPGLRMAYRGQPRTYGTLVPSFRRSFTRESVGAATIIEQRLIEAFREHYQNLPDLGPDMPGPHRIRAGYDLRCLSVMQHYEIPTRLLDWSASFWTSVYFACASEPEEDAELWLYDRRLFEPQRHADASLATLLDTATNAGAEPLLLMQRDDTLLVEVDPQLTPRMTQQAAHHTVCTAVFADHAPLLFDLAGGERDQPDGSPAFQRLTIASRSKPKVLQYLAEQENITAGTVFPDVVGLGRFLRWQFDSLRTMML